MTASVETPVPGELPGTGRPSTARSAATLPDVDRRIAVAFGDLGRIRSRFADSPSGEGVTACVAAEQAMNELLDLRLALTAGANPLR